MTGANPDPADFLEALVRIESRSGEERRAAAWLVERMRELGFESFVDPAGNAVGTLGNGPRALVLLGHIDTVSGDVRVRREAGRLYGRGTVDAKGPLAAFTLAAARVGAREGFTIAVIGAVEEESASSKGARHVAANWPRPEACVIGEPSSWRKLCLGYKGRLLVRYLRTRLMTHTAGRDRGVCEEAIDFWNALRAQADRFNEGIERAFDQLTPSIRAMRSESDGLSERVEVSIGIRVPASIDVAELKREVTGLAGREAAVEFTGEERAIRAEKNNALVRAFLAAIREEGERPAFSVKTGTADMNVVGPVWNCPILAYGPGDSTLDHTPDEHLEIDELNASIRVLERVLRTLTSV